MGRLCASILVPAVQNKTPPGKGRNSQHLALQAVSVRDLQTDWCEQQRNDPSALAAVEATLRPFRCRATWNRQRTHNAGSSQLFPV